MENANTYDREYTRRRADVRTMFGYGLERRTAKLLEVLERLGFWGQELKICDMGCSDGSMLKAVTGTFDTAYATGVDIFPHGAPTVQLRATLSSFVHHDLHQNFPYPYEDGCFNVIVASAFYKQLPHQELFLRECTRMLEPGGHLIMLDPRLWAVKLFGALGYFDRRYCQQPWSPATLAQQLPSELKLTYTEKYWTAPNHWLYQHGAEYLIPNVLSMHQIVVLTRK